MKRSEAHWRLGWLVSEGREAQEIRYIKAELRATRFVSVESLQLFSDVSFL
jgi:hypothetical protein